MWHNPDCFQALFHTFPNLIGWHPYVFWAKCNIFLHYACNNLIVWVLEHHPGAFADIPQAIPILRILSIYPKRPAPSFQQYIEMLGQRGFPRTIMP